MRWIECPCCHERRLRHGDHSPEVPCAYCFASLPSTYVDEDAFLEAALGTTHPFSCVRKEHYENVVVDDLARPCRCVVSDYRVLADVDGSWQKLYFVERQFVDDWGRMFPVSTLADRIERTNNAQVADSSQADEDRPIGRHDEPLYAALMAWKPEKYVRWWHPARAIDQITDSSQTATPEEPKSP